MVKGNKHEGIPYCNKLARIFVIIIINRFFITTVIPIAIVVKILCIYTSSFSAASSSSLSPQFEREGE